MNAEEASEFTEHVRKLVGMASFVQGERADGFAAFDEWLAFMQVNPGREPVVVDDAKVWRKHPGLGGADGIGVRHPNGSGHQWYTVDRARQVITELGAGLAVLARNGQEGTDV